ncbi:MAG: hypothetical protein H7318_06775 [Oligoflexus sp.]|nr:hypothetical protein [Oligoflexus sp.]
MTKIWNGYWALMWGVSLVYCTKGDIMLETRESASTSVPMSIGIAQAEASSDAIKPKSKPLADSQNQAAAASPPADSLGGTDPDHFYPVFMMALKDRTLPKSTLRDAKGQIYQFISDASSIQMIGAKQSNLGSYRISTGTGVSGIHLQTPHGESDLQTRKIGELLCIEQSYESCATNTWHRRSFDFAHETISPFQTFTRAIVSKDPKALIVQLHGFEGGKRRGVREQNAKMILSIGSDSALLQAALKALHLDQDPSILVYGEGTRDLGAMRNAQRQLISSVGKGHFLHIEMSLPLRERLASDRKEREQLNDIIREVKKKFYDEAKLSTRP